MVEYEDLSEEQATELPSLKIADSTKFSQGLIPVVPKVRQQRSWNESLMHASSSSSRVKYRLTSLKRALSRPMQNNIKLVCPNPAQLSTFLRCSLTGRWKKKTVKILSACRLLFKNGLH